MQIDRVTLASRDIEAQRHFYGELMGLPTEIDAEGALHVQVGRSELIFQHDESVKPFYHIAFNIFTNQAEAALAWAQERFAVLDYQGELLSHSTSWNSDGFYFYDADGNIMELIARHTLPELGAAVFSPEAIQCVSEVGVPVPDIPGTVERFERTLALPYYSGDRESFNALGDEHGLFIVVIEGRHWFPTQTPAHPLPMTAEVRAAIAEPVELTGPGYRILARPF